MNCSKCHADNPPDSAFCVECGSELEVQCRNCGHSVAPRFKFCNKCGHDLSNPVAAPEPLSSLPTPRTPSPEGDRRQATVLFSDLSGYTAMNERLDPKKWRRSWGA